MGRVGRVGRVERVGRVGRGREGGRVGDPSVCTFEFRLGGRNVDTSNISNPGSPRGTNA